MSQRLPLVVILGATGSGKTKLSIELARKFKGEIISADSMQIYKGLNIITAKATKEEQAAAPHHLLDILEPHEMCTVVEYRNKALKILCDDEGIILLRRYAYGGVYKKIDNLINKNKLPIVVGGTNYYIEALLWKILIEEPGDQTRATPDTPTNKDHELSSEELHKKLKLLDPNMAKRLHPNNKRKILRSLEVLRQKGRPHSEILQEQHSSRGASQTCGGLRYSNALILRLQCEKAVLDERLNNRVDKMMEQGLVEELTNFHAMYNENRINNTAEAPDYTKGIFQSIGFKEFHSYLIMNPEERASETGRQTLEKCIEDLKMVTRRYAKKQNKWTTNRFLGRRDREVPPMFGLDVTDLENWDKNVTQPAIEIVQSYISETECQYRKLEMQAVNSTANAEDDTYFCDICERVFVGNLQWADHLKSNRHRKMKQKKNSLDR